MTRAPEPRRYARLARVFHWLTAALVFSTLFVGFVMVSSVSEYAGLVTIHRTLGAAVLAVVLVRMANRLIQRAPVLPPTVGALERKLIVASEISLYALLLIQPLLGWGMVSASGGPVLVFGFLRLPRIAPFDPGLFWVLRQAHSVVAYALMAVIAAHVSAVVLHTVTLRDGMLSRMAFPLRVIGGHETEGG